MTILRVLNGGTAKLKGSTIENNDMVEYVALALSLDTAPSTPSIEMRSTNITSSTGVSQAFIMSQGNGANIDMESIRFTENKGGLVRMLL